MDLQDKIDYAYSAYSSLGLDRDQIGGILGSMMGESGRSLNTSSFNPNDPGRGSFGIANWNGSRWDGLEAFAAARGKDVTDYKTQIDYSVKELQTTEKKALDRVKEAKDAAAASKAFTNYYERPLASAANHTGRAQNATYALGFMSATPGKSPSGTMLGTYNPLNVLDKALDIGQAAMKGGISGAAKAAAKSDLLDPVVDPIEAAIKDMFGMSRDIKDPSTGKTTGKTQSTQVGGFLEKLAGEPNIGAKVGAIAGGIFGGPQGALLGGLAGQGIGALIAGMISPNVQTPMAVATPSYWGDTNYYPDRPDKPSGGYDPSGYSSEQQQAASDWADSHPNEMGSVGLY